MQCESIMLMVGLSFLTFSRCLLTVFFFYLYGDHLDLHSFPTRRSSDLADEQSKNRRSLLQQHHSGQKFQQTFRPAIVMPPTDSNDGLVRAAKDITAGSAGGIAQVLTGQPFDIVKVVSLDSLPFSDEDLI